MVDKQISELEHKKVINRKDVSRIEEIETIIEIINNSEDYRENSLNGLVILLNGGWGTGKTTFIKNLEEKIKMEKNMEIIAKYISWENDFYDNPYIPFFATINDSKGIIEKTDELIIATNKIMGKNLLNIGFNISKGFLKNKLGVDVDFILSEANEISEELSKKTNYLEEYKEFIKLKKQIQDDLTKLCSGTKKIFIVDELDRCNPKFAIDTLEIAKHFFDIKNCVFIISVDKEQICESIKTIYGSGMDADVYFSKFFDYQFDLLKISPLDTIDISEITNKKIDYEELKIYIEFIFKKLNISIRDGRKILNNFIKKLNKYNFTSLQARFILLLISLKQVDLLGYKMLISNKFNKYINGRLGSTDTKYENYSDILAYDFGEMQNFINSMEFGMENYFLGKAYKKFAKDYQNGEKEKQDRLNSNDFNYKATQKLYKHVFIIKDGLTFEEIIYKLTN